jgi:hypothetical protein
MPSIKSPLGKVVNAVSTGALGRILEQIPPSAYAFRVSKLVEAVEAEHVAFQKQNNALVRKHGVADPKFGHTMRDAPAGQIEAFNDGINELFAMEIMIPYEPIIWSKIPEAAQTKISASDMHVLRLAGLLVETAEEVAP